MKLVSQFWQNSMCIGRYLHRYDIVKELDDGVIENCRICHKSKFFKAVGGQLEANHYMAYHLRLGIGNLPIPNYIWHEFKYQPLSDLIESPYA